MSSAGGFFFLLSNTGTSTSTSSETESIKRRQVDSCQGQFSRHVKATSFWSVFRCFRIVSYPNLITHGIVHSHWKPATHLAQSIFRTVLLMPESLSLRRYHAIIPGTLRQRRRYAGVTRTRCHFCPCVRATVVLCAVLRDQTMEQPGSIQSSYTVPRKLGNEPETALAITKEEKS